jgi:putative ABC transport system permease protein
MTRLWRALVWQPRRAQFGRALLSVFAIALGVALGLAIHLMNRAATNEMARASRSLYAQADLIVQGTSLGFDEALYAVIARLPGIALANPVVEVHAHVIGRSGTLTLIGRDLLRASSSGIGPPESKRSRESLNIFDANNLLLSAGAAQTFHVATGDSISVQVGMENVAFHVIGIVPGEEDNAYLDIAAAQWRLRQLGRLTRIEINLAPGVDANAIAPSIEEHLPPDVKVTTPL